MNDKDLSNIDRTNWAALESIDDATIDYSDIPPLTDRFFENATLRIPVAHTIGDCHPEKAIALANGYRFTNAQPS